MFLRQSTSQIIRFGPFLDSTDGVTPETSLTIAQADMQLSKDGAAFAQKNASGNATHDTDGWYSTTLNTTDTATAGVLEIQINVTGSLPVWKTYFILTATAYDALQTGTFNNLGGTAQTADHTAGIADIPTVSEFNARTLLSASYFDPAADTVANVTTVATTTTNTDMRGTDSANTVVPPSVAQFNARTILSASYALEASIAALNNFDPANDAVANVTLVATTTTNTDMVGTDNAMLASSYTAPDNAGITQTQTDIANLNDISVTQILTTQMTESYSADGVAPTLAQSLFLTMQNLQDYSYAGVTQTVKKLDGMATAATYTLNDAINPTSKTRAT